MKVKLIRLYRNDIVFNEHVMDKWKAKFLWFIWKHTNFDLNGSLLSGRDYIIVDIDLK